jgi:hypothetical protein
MACERKFRLGAEDADFGSADIIDKNGLAVPKLRGDSQSHLLRDGGAVEKNRKRISPSALRISEYSQHVYRYHVSLPMPSLPSRTLGPGDASDPRGVQAEVDAGAA